MSVLINGLLTPGSYYCLFCQVANQSMNIKNHRMLSPIGKAICIMAIIFSSLDMPLGGVSADVLHKTVGAVGGGRGATKIAQSHGDGTDMPFTSSKIRNFQFLGRKARPNEILAHEDEMLERDLEDGEDGIPTSSSSNPIIAMAEVSCYKLYFATLLPSISLTLIFFNGISGV